MPVHERPHGRPDDVSLARQLDTTLGSAADFLGGRDGTICRLKAQFHFVKRTPPEPGRRERTYSVAKAMTFDFFGTLFRFEDTVSWLRGVLVTADSR